VATSLTVKAIAVWLAILTCAVLNGALREGVLMRLFGKPAALVLSGVLLSAIILAISLMVVPWFGRLAGARYVHVGLLWLWLTLIFEFGFGRLVQHQSWQRLIEAYTFENGNIWPAVLVVIVAAPWLAARVRGFA
jgi:hypothetical protein